MAHNVPTARALKHLRDWKHNLNVEGAEDTFNELDEACDAVAAENPAAMLAAFVAFFDEGQAMEVVAPLAAGPLEDFIAAHGEKLIGEIERLSCEHPPFRHALGGVLQNTMPDALWERVLAAGPDQRW